MIPMLTHTQLKSADVCVLFARHGTVLLHIAHRGEILPRFAKGTQALSNQWNWSNSQQRNHLNSGRALEYNDYIIYINKL